MQIPASITEISERARRIGYSIKDMARDADLNEATFYRALKGGIDHKTSTIRQLGQAVVAREIEVRDYLLGLHPLPAVSVTVAVGDGTPSPSVPLPDGARDDEQRPVAA